MQRDLARVDGLPKPDQQSELPRHATGPFVHADKKRKPGDYCKAKCALCYVAAVFYMSARVEESRMLLALKAGEGVGLGGKMSENMIALIVATNEDLASVNRGKKAQ